MVENNDKEHGKIIPTPMAELEWVWVIGQAGEKIDDIIFVIEMNEKEGGQRRRIVPVFETRDDAAKMRLRLCQNLAGEYGEQSMRLSEVGRFAAKNDLEIMLLDDAGTILAHMEAKIEQVSVH